MSGSRSRRARWSARVLTMAIVLTASLTMTTTSGSSVAADGSGLPQGSDPVALDPADFSADIDHNYWPMRPRTRWTYRETDEKGRAVEVVVIVTTRTRRVANGITARVVRDTVTRDGVILEDTFDWYAQDRTGNVWYLGEDTAEFEDGKVVSHGGSWEAGVDGALAGIALPADPQPGIEYRQEYYAGKAEDNGEVLSVDEMAEVPYGYFTGVLLTKDTNAVEPKVLEYKLYAPGIGPVLTVDISGGSGREELVSMGRASRRAGTGPLGSPRQ